MTLDDLLRGLLGEDAFTAIKGSLDPELLVADVVIKVASDDGSETPKSVEAVDASDPTAGSVYILTGV